jgi:hypothetical protein
MARVHAGRTAAAVPDEAVVFIIGMRFNRLWQVWKWLPAFRAMPKMLKELEKNPELGLVGTPQTFISGRTLLLLQHWESFTKLEAYARSADQAHLPAWRAFNQATRGNAAVGIYHETYLLTPATAEAVYVNMPPFGMGGAFGTRDADGTARTAAQRLGR